MSIKKPQLPEVGLYDLIFTDKGFFRGGRYDKGYVHVWDNPEHIVPRDCLQPTDGTNRCPVCKESYYDLEADEGA